MKTYFSAWDKQCSRWMYSGVNSKTEKQCVEALIDYMNSDNEEDLSSLPYDEQKDLVLCNGFEIVEHESKLEEEMDY